MSFDVMDFEYQIKYGGTISREKQERLEAVLQELEVDPVEIRRIVRKVSKAKYNKAK